MSSRSIYLVGAPGTGKSTLMRALISELLLDPAEEIHLCRETWVRVLRETHDEDSVQAWMWGRLREKFPGTDALGAAASRYAREWINENPSDLPPLTLGEGVRLANVQFLLTLDAASPLTLVYLSADNDVLDERAASKERAAGHTAAEPGKGFGNRTGAHNVNFRKGAATRAVGLRDDLSALGIPVLEFDSGLEDPEGIARGISQNLDWD